MVSVKIESAEALHDILNSIDTVLFDCDGVLWRGNNAINGAQDTIQMLKSMGKKIFLVTNNSTKSQTEYARKCTDLGFEVNMEEIICISYVTAQYMKDILKFNGKIYLVGSMGLVQELDKANLQHTGYGPDVVHGTLQDWVKVKLDPEVTCVLVGYDEHISYMKMMKAASYLQNKNCKFIVTNEDSILPVDRKDIVMPGTGSCAAGIKEASGRVPDLIIGKPHSTLLDCVKEKYHIVPKRTLMVGDRLNTDILFANNYGLQSLLVLTGVSSLEDVESCMKSNSIEHQKQIPNFYIESVKDLAQFMNL